LDFQSSIKKPLSIKYVDMMLKKLSDLHKQLTRLEILLEQVTLDQEQRRSSERFFALSPVSQMLVDSLDLQIVLNQVMDATIQLTQAERGFLMLRDLDGGMAIKAARNFDQQTLDGNEMYSRTIANQVLDTGQALLTTNASQDPRFATQASIMAQSLHSIMAAPLRSHGTVIGVAYVDSRVITSLFEPEDLAALEAFAGQAAVAIDNARLFQQTDQELAETVETLTELRRIDRQLNETLDADRAMQITLEWTTRTTRASYAYLGLLEGQPPVIRTAHVYGLAEGNHAPTTLEDVYPAIQTVIESGQTVSNAQDHTEPVMILPILRERKVQGVVILHRLGGLPFSQSDVDRAERIVNRSAVAIDNARLYAAVQAADRAKSEFVATVAHDLKVPMTSIMGYAALTKSVGDSQKNLVGRQGEFLDKIVDTVRRMEVLVSDLADISRVESGHFRMDSIQVPVERLVEAVKDNTILQIEERSHTLVEKIAPGLPPLWVDYYRLLQVLTNLVSNAYKYTPNGGTITLSAALEGDRVRFGVLDTGIGLSPKQVAKLGTKFWRADDDYTRSQPGTGLGFAITSQIVHLMGSEIQIESQVGQGSRFSFSVPTYTA
jgi:signal transduction histidine kinase